MNGKHFIVGFISLFAWLIGKTNKRRTFQQYICVQNTVYYVHFHLVCTIKQITDWSVTAFWKTFYFIPVFHRKFWAAFSVEWMFSLEENGGIRSFSNSESVLLLDKPLSQNHRVRNQLHFFLSTVQRCDWKTLGASCNKEQQRFVVN